MFSLLFSVALAQATPTDWVLLGANVNSGALAYLTLAPSELSIPSSKACDYGIAEFGDSSVTLVLSQPKRGVARLKRWPVYRGRVLRSEECAPFERSSEAVRDASRAFDEAGIVMSGTLPEGIIERGKLSWRPEIDPEAEAVRLFTLARRSEGAEERAHLAKLLALYPSTRVAKSAQRRLDEIGVVGTAAPELEVDYWFGESADLTSGKATVLVFFEVWCPHCRREVPALNQLSERWGERGLKIVALTQITRGLDRSSVEAFISEHALSFPVAKESGAMSTAFQVHGIPAAAVVKEGQIVWRGHPSKLSSALIEGWLR